MKNAFVVMLVSLLGLFSAFLLPAADGGTEGKTVLRLGLMPLAEVETSLHGGFTIGVAAGPGYNFSAEEWGLDYGPTLRYYYNLERRRLQGRRAANFAADYVGLEIRHELLNKIPDEAMASVTWGIRRNLGRAFYYGFCVGVGPRFRSRETVLSAKLDLSFGLTLQGT